MTTHTGDETYFEREKNNGGRPPLPPRENSGLERTESVQGRVRYSTFMAFRRVVWERHTTPGRALEEAIGMWLANYAPMEGEDERDPIHPVTTQGRMRLLIRCGVSVDKAQQWGMRTEMTEEGWKRLMINRRRESGVPELMIWDDEDREVLEAMGIPTGS